MKKILLIICLIGYSLFSYAHSDRLAIGHRVGFTENKGQWPNQVAFRTQTQTTTLWIEKDRFTIVAKKHYKDTTLTGWDSIFSQNEHAFRHFAPQKGHAYQIKFEGSNENAQVFGQDKLEGYENFYLGNDPKHWASECLMYGVSYYSNLYNGIDLRVMATERAIKYEFVVAPKSSTRQIQMKYLGVDGLSLKDNTLQIATTIGILTESVPLAYQIINGDTLIVDAKYHIKNDIVKFEIGEYDTQHELVIDPLLHFSTYTGSAADNWGTTAAFDSYKNSYTAGLVFASGYPVSLGAFNTTYNGNADIGIFKFDTTGGTRLFATYLGGTWADMPHSMYVNASDELVIFGTTGSANFPTSENAFSRNFRGGSNISYLCFNNYEAYRTIYYPNGSDLFISRFNSTGTRLQASTYIGGGDNDGLNFRSRYNINYVTIMQGNDSLYYNYGDGARGEIITDNLNNVYIGTTTMSTDFPTTNNCVQRRSGGKQDGIVLKIDYNLSHLLWSTYLGGTNDDAVYSVDVDHDYNLVVCGGTTSLNFPTTSNAYRRRYIGGSADGFVCKISYEGDRIMGSTYYGSGSYDQCYFVRCGKQDQVFLFGQTKAPGNTLIINADYGTPNSGQFLASLKPNLDTLLWSTVFGTGNGQPNISPTAFVADVCNRVYAVGWGRDFVGYNNVQWNTMGTWNMEITPDAYQTNTDGQDFYLMSLAEDASGLDYATFFGEVHQNDGDGGGDHVDGGTSRFDRLGTLYQSVCASCGGHSGFPTSSNVWSHENLSNNCNNALFRFNIHSDFPVAEFVQPAVGCVPYQVTFHNTGRGTSYLWDFGDGTTSTNRNPVHTYNRAGEYTIRLIAYQNNGCITSDTMERTLLILNNTSRLIEPKLSCDGTPIQIGHSPMPGCTYEWIEGNVSDSSISNPWVSENGDYILYLTSSAGCIETDTFRVRFVRLIDSVITGNPRCVGGDDGWAMVVVSTSDLDSLTYTWDGVTTTNAIMSGFSASTANHNVVVSNQICTSSATFRISDPEPMVIQKDAEPFLCKDSCSGWIHLQSYCIDTLLENLCEGTYIVNINDSNGCPYSDTTIVIQDHQLDNMSVWADHNTIYLGESTTLHATDIPGATYEWSPNNNLETPTAASTKVTPTDTIENYHVIVTDAYGCQWSGDIEINCTEVICGKPNIFIPNAFTPNNDGKNDKLCFRGEYVIDFHICIFSRWGEMVFETHSINDCWDGRYNDNWCMPGVYTYTCKITCEAGQTTEFKGDITLIR